MDVATGAHTRESKRIFERTLSKAFNAAHLLTASLRQAEAAVLDAIDRFDQIAIRMKRCFATRFVPRSKLLLNIRKNRPDARCRRNFSLC